MVTINRLISTDEEIKYFYYYSPMPSGVTALETSLDETKRRTVWIQCFVILYKKGKNC